MSYQLNFKDPYLNIRMRLRNAFAVCDLYVLFLHSDHFFILKGWGVPKLILVKNPHFTFSGREFSALELLNH